ncbi:MAG TPA: EamA family transporter [Steroidobacteraceae bacterium]|nr:EamA family transporter [Steroidobacteraceae bacterium]
MPAATRPPARPALPVILACLLAVYVLWGTTYYAIKVAITGFATFFFVGTRFIAAGGLILLWQALRGAPLPTPAQWRGAALIGCLLLLAGNGTVALGEHWVSSGAAVALVSSVPLTTAAWSCLFGERPARLEWLAMGVGTTGIAIMLLGHDLRSSSLGVAVVLGGSICWSLGTVLARRIEVPPGATGFGAEMLCAGVGAFVISALAHESWTFPAAPRPWAAWGYLVVFGSLIGFSAFRFLVERVSATLATSYAYVNPPVALLVGWWLGHEQFSAPLLLGLPVVLSAVALQTWAHARLYARGT